MTRQHGYDFKLASAYESTYGTPPGSGYVFLPVKTFGLKRDRPFEKDPRLGLGRGGQALYQGRISCSGPVVVPVDVANIGYWLRQFLGSPSTTGTGPYTHVFTSGGASLPSMSLEAQHSSASTFEMFDGVYGSSIAFGLADDGEAIATLDLVGADCTKAGSTAAGSPSSETYEAFRQFYGSLQLDSSDLGDVLSASFTYDNGLNIERLVNGAAKIDEPDLGDDMVTGQIDMRFADATLYDKAVAATSVDLDFIYEISASKKLTVSIPEVYLTPTSPPVDGPGGLNISFSFEAVVNTSAGHKLQATLINDVASY